MFYRQLSPLILSLSLLLSGCHTPTHLVKAPPTPVSPSSSAPKAQNTPNEQETTNLQQCQHELEVLRTINAEQYSSTKREFGQLMSGAAQYANLRKDINAATQDTVDALYHYQVSLLCADINQQVLNSLVKRGVILK